MAGRTYCPAAVRSCHVQIVIRPRGIEIFMLRLTCLALLIFAGIAAADVQTGMVRSGEQPIPGATVTAECGTDKITTTTDDAGRFEMGGLPSTSCKYTVLMFGFEPVQKDA